MRGFYLLITDKTSFLSINSEVPNHTHWPLIKNRPSKSWHIALADYLTYGLIKSYKVTYIKHKRPQLLDAKLSFYVALVEVPLETLVDNIKQVKRWSKANHERPLEWTIFQQAFTSDISFCRNSAIVIKSYIKMIKNTLDDDNEALHQECEV